MKHRVQLSISPVVSSKFLSSIMVLCSADALLMTPNHFHITNNVLATLLAFDCHTHSTLTAHLSPA